MRPSLLYVVRALPDSRGVHQPFPHVLYPPGCTADGVGGSEKCKGMKLTMKLPNDPGFLTQVVIIWISNALRRPKCWVVGCLGWSCLEGQTFRRRSLWEDFGNEPLRES